MRSSSAFRRSSSSLRISAAANGSNATSERGSPRHSSRASRRRSGALLGLELARRRDESLEAAEVDRLRIDGEAIPRRLGQQEIGAEHAPQRRDRVLERCRRRLRRLLAPERVEEEEVGRDDVIRLEDEHGEDGAVARPAESELPAAVCEHLERAEDPELRHKSFVASLSTDCEARTGAISAP